MLAYLRNRESTRSARVVSAATVLLCCAGASQAWDVSHHFRLRPGGSVPPQVEWVHKEFGHSQQDAVIDTCTNGPITVGGIAGGYFGWSVPLCDTAVGSTYAYGFTSCSVATATNRLVEGDISSWGTAKAKLDPGFRRALAKSSSSTLVRARGGRQLGNGAIDWKKNWKSTPPIGGSSGWREVIRDPVIVRAVNTTTGAVTEATLMSVEGSVFRGEMSWQNNMITIGTAPPGSPGEPVPSVRLDIVINSPYTVEQGTIRIEVQGGMVVFSEATGIYAAAPVPPVGAVGGTFAIPAPDETFLNYNLGLNPLQNYDVNVDFDIGGEEEDADAADWTNYSYCMTTDLGEGPDRSDISVPVAPSQTLGYNAARGQFHLADNLFFSDGMVRRPEALILPWYQPNMPPGAMPRAAYVRLWAGRPGFGGVPMAGDMVTNRLLSSNWDHVYRVGTSDRLNRSRAMNQVVIDMSWAPPIQSFFEVFVEVALDGPQNGSLFVPQACVQDHQTQCDAMQYTASQNRWQQITDPQTGRGVSIPFSLVGQAERPPCRPDVDDDGFVTGDDAMLFTMWFEAGDPRADYDGDGFITGDDYQAFIEDFERGC